MLKRVTLLYIIVSICIIFFAFNFVTADASSNYQFSYRIANGSAVVTGFSTAPTSAVSIEIPSSVTISGVVYSVTSIDTSAFAGTSSAYNTLISGVTFPDTVTSIGESSFSYCTALSSIKFTSSLRTIGLKAFYNCTSLLSVNLPNGLLTTGANAFQNCSNLKSANIPGSVTSLGAGLYKSCGLLESVNIGEGITSITSETFCYCYYLKYIVLPSTCTSLVGNATNDCRRLEYFTILANSLSISGSLSLPTYLNPQDALPRQTGLGGYVTGYTKFCIQSDTANDPVRTALSGKGVRASNIIKGVYSYAENLNDGMFGFSGTRSPFGNVATITGFATGAAPNVDTDINFPGTVTCNGVTYTVTAIGNDAFNYNIHGLECLNIKSVTFPNTITSIGSDAFHDCSSLVKAYISGGVKTVGSRAFKSCGSLSEVIMEEGVTTIYDEAFYACGIGYIVFPSTVNTLYLNSLNSCSYLKKVVVLSNTATITTSASGIGPTDSPTQFYVRSNALKTTISGLNINAGNITVAPNNVLILKPSYGYNVPDVINVVSNVYTLATPAGRSHFTFDYWSDGVNAYHVGDTIQLTGFAILKAKWNFNSADTSKVTRANMDDALNFNDDLEKLVTKNEDGIIDSTTTVNVKVSESQVLHSIDKRIMGTQYEALDNKMLIDPNTKGLSNEYLSMASDLYPIRVARWGGTSSNAVNLMANIGPYETRRASKNLITGVQTSDKVEFGPVEFIKSVLAVNPDAEFIFVLSMDVQTPEESANFLRFLKDDKNASEFGALRASLGLENPIKVIAFELGNEVYGSCRYLPESDANYQFIFNEAAAYATVAETHIAAIKAIDSEVELIPVIVADMDFWRRTWNRAVIRYLDPYCNSIYAIHQYFDNYNTPITKINEVLNNITEIYRDEVGFDKNIKFAMTEHAYWGMKGLYGSLLATLGDLTFFNGIYQRDDMYCSNYHCASSYKIWSLMRDIDGEIMPTGISKGFETYNNNLGDRVIKTSYNDMIRSSEPNVTYTTEETNIASNPTLSVLATAKDDDTLILSLVNNTFYSGDYQQINLNFNFENNYTLVSETVFTAPNLFSYVCDTNTKDIFTTTTTAKNIPNFTSYTLGPKRAVFLTLKTTSSIPHETYAAQKTESNNAIYRDLIFGKDMDSDGIVKLDFPSKINRILFKGCEKNVSVSACTDYGVWEKLAASEALAGGSVFNSYTDHMYKSVKIENASVADIAVLSEIDLTKGMDISLNNGYFTAYARINGVDCFDNPTVVVTGGILTYHGSSLFEINKSGNIIFKMGDGVTMLDVPVYITSTDSYATINENFNNYGVTSGLLSGSNVEFGNGNWISKSGNMAALFGFDDSATSTSSNANKMDSIFMRLSSRTTGDGEENTPCIYYNGDRERMSAKQHIHFDIARNYGSVSYGVRFMVHNDGKDYYELEIKKWQSDSIGPMWTLYKVVNNQATILTNGLYFIQMSGVGYTYDITVDDGKINWRVITMDTGANYLEMGGNYTDTNNPFSIAGNDATFGFFAKCSTSVNNEYGIYVDNVSVESLGGVNTYNYTADGDGVTIDGVADGIAIPTDFEIPNAIDGLNVIGIAESAFENKGLTNLTIPQTITSIGANAFTDNLIDTLAIPDAITTIGGQAFSGNTHLTSVTIGTGISSLNSTVFNGCTNLASITILSNVLSVNGTITEQATNVSGGTIYNVVNTGVKNTLINAGVLAGNIVVLNVGIGDANGVVTLVPGCDINGSKLVAASYTEGGKLCSFEITNISNTSKNVSTQFNLSENFKVPNGGRAMYTVWRDLENLVPVTNSIKEDA